MAAARLNLGGDRSPEREWAAIGVGNVKQVESQCRRYFTRSVRVIDCRGLV